ncbi:phasin family protein [Bosea sp. LC85]|uniref:phasin family protein n=1 Tax=Bosea sp. LC85 TaxID=1502851 RepID=UPI0004E311C4|nr:phasin family protein [Bosea sp. LC85]KFC65338.1 phasin family protein [Bosea sp. LC85]
MDDMPKSLMEPWQASLAAVARTNRLALDNLQKLSTLQRGALQTYMELGFARLKAAADIKDAQDLVAFQAGQIEATMSLTETLINDGKALADLCAGIMAECSTLPKDLVGRPPMPLRAQPPRKAA